MNENIISESYEQESSFKRQEHLSDYLKILVKRIWIVILLSVVIVGYVAFISFREVPVYKSKAKIMIERKFPSIGMKDKTYDTGEKSFYNTQLSLLTSRSLVSDVIEALHLWEDVSAKSEDNSPGEKSQKGNQQDAQLNNMWNSQLVNRYLSKLEVQPVGKTNLIEITFKGESPELITRILNSHLDISKKASVQMGQMAADKAYEWLKKELEEQKSEVEANRHAIHEYKKTFDIVKGEGSQDIQYQELLGINSALIKAKAERIRFQTIYDQLQAFSVDDKDLMPLPEISKDFVIQKLRAMLIDLKSQKYKLDQRLGAMHPQMIQIESAIKKLKKEITIEVKRLKKHVKANLDRALAYEKSLEDSLNTQKQKAMDYDEKGIDYQMLRQKLRSSQKIYDTLLTQSKELSLIMGKEIGNIHIVDRAEVPLLPFKPEIAKNIIMAVVISLFLGLTLAFFIEYMDNSIKNPDDVLTRLNIPVIGTLPYNKALLGQENRLALPWNEEQKEIESIDDTPDPLFGISGRLPQTTIDQADGYAGQVLVVQSATMDEGKTTVLTQLAKSLVDSGLRVLMLDFDLYRPSLHNMFGVDNNNGLLNAIDKISTFRLNSGSLTECSIDDLFFLIGLKKKNGLLAIKNEAQTMRIYFLNGRLVHVQDQKLAEASRLGSMLLKSELLTEEQLQDALDRQGRTNQPLGYILINSGYISREKLQGPLKLQIEESLQKLFSWKQGTYSFKPGRANLHKNEIIEFGEDYSPMINALGELEGSRFIEDQILSCVQSGYDENLFLLTSGSGSSMKKTQINQKLMAKLFEILKQRFDIILVDTMPLDTTSGIATLSKLVDGVILVIKAGGLSAASLNEAINCISDKKIIGAVLNQVKSNQSYYYK